jgi:ABC-type proline/glycine betaine transport system permease subunit
VTSYQWLTRLILFAVQLAIVLLLELFTGHLNAGSLALVTSGIAVGYLVSIPLGIRSNRRHQAVMAAIGAAPARSWPALPGTRHTTDQETAHARQEL